MTQHEANDRLKKCQVNEKQLWALNSLYIALDLEKDVFCKIVDAVGLDVLLGKQNHFDRLLQAMDEMEAKERYIKAKARIEELELGNMSNCDF